MPFPKGHKLAPGGKREGAGRPAEWLKEKCREAGPKLVEFLIAVANGENMEQVVTGAGETVGVPAAVKDRIKAAEIVLERGYGKVSQPVEGSLEIGKTVWLLPDGFKNPSEQKRD